MRLRTFFYGMTKRFTIGLLLASWILTGLSASTTVWAATNCTPLIQGKTPSPTSSCTTGRVIGNVGSAAECATLCSQDGADCCEWYVGTAGGAGDCWSDSGAGPSSLVDNTDWYASVCTACTLGANCSAATPACGQTTTGIDECGLSCSKTGPACPSLDAAYVSQTVPTTMIAGQPYAVTVTMQNTGGPSWTAGQQLNLGAQNPQDNTTWVSTARVPIASGDNITTGQNKAFTFNVTAPATPATYNFQWRMVQDGPGGWFGVMTPNVAIVVTPPTIGTAPSITTQPANKTVTAGQTASFSVAASGTAPLTYQWQRMGATWTNISGATSANYTTPATVQTDSGAQFRCHVSNLAGQVDSNAATLTVNPVVGVGIPVVTAAQTSFSGTIGTAINRVGVSATNCPSSYNVTGLPPGLTFATLGMTACTAPASGTTPIVAIQGTPTTAGNFTITLSATNSAGTSASKSVTVVITKATPAPDLTLDAAKAFPVPFKPASGHSVITFSGLKMGSTIKIFTITGELVAQLQSDGPSIQWPVLNKDNEKVASGVYVFQIKNEVSEKRGKLVIVR
jgi:hypothetical protein